MDHACVWHALKALTAAPFEAHTLTHINNRQPRQATADTIEAEAVNTHCKMWRYSTWRMVVQ